MVDNKKGFRIASHIFLIFVSLLCIIPFILLITSSLTDETTLTREGYTFFPSKWGLESYLFMFRNKSLILRAYAITIFTTVVGTVSGLFLTILTAYPLSKKDLPGRNIFAFIVFFTMLFNGGLVPTYIMWTRYFHINNTVWAMLIPSLLLNAFNVIMMRTYFTANIPEEILEAARIDSAGEFYILFKIVIPMSLPMIATLALLVGLGYWNDWKNGLYYITDTKLFSVQTMLNNMLQDVRFLASGGGGANAGEIAATIPSNGIKMAIAVVGAIPVIIVYPFFQKYFVKGIAIGGVKG